jgi:hypothetical protein
MGPAQRLAAHFWDRPILRPGSRAGARSHTEAHLWGLARSGSLAIDSDP